MEKAAGRPHLFIFSFNENVIFLIRCLIFLLLAVLYLHHIAPQYEGSYDSALLDKVQRLEAVDGPKIVLLGNSNLVFGIDSALIEQEMGMPVVNMGLHGGLGNAFHERMSQYHVQEGDIYVLCHSDYDDQDTILNGELAWITIENHYHLWRILRWKDLGNMAQAFPAYLRKAVNLYSAGTGNVDEGGVYARSAFNEYGDCGLYRPCSVFTQIASVSAPHVTVTVMERINRLSVQLKQKGAVLLIAGYPIGMGEATEPRSAFVQFQKELEQASACPVISDFTDYMYDYSYFYDYNYLHLNSHGAKLRTEQLVKDLKRWMKKNEA